MGISEFQRCLLHVLRLIVENDIEQRAVDLQSTFRAACIVNKAEFSESIHEKADTRASSANHFGQSLLADLGYNGLRNSILAKVESNSKTRARRFSLELNSWSTRSSS